MVRKQTWILLAVFVVLLGATFYLQKNPLPSSASQTPSPTAAPRLFEGLNASDIVSLESIDSTGKAIQISQDGQGTWSLGPDGKVKVETGLAEEIRSQILEFRAVTTLPGGYQLDALGLQTPTRSLILRDKSGKQTQLHIGSATPTESGYYVRVDNNAPVVVAKETIDGTLGLFTNAVPTPVPAAPAITNPQPTSTP